MGIDVLTTTLWAELATWGPTALESILRPEHWAIHGATRMGKAVTFEDRIDDGSLDAECLVRGVAAAESCMALLTRADVTASRWTEPPPPSVADARGVAAAIEASGEFVESVSPAGVELLLSVAHALQAGAKLAPGATERELRALIETPPRVAQKSSGPFSALLVMSVDTIWVPTTLKYAWDSPAWVLASSRQLAADLAALPELLRDIDGDASDDLAGARQLVEALEDALEIAGHGCCLRMAG